MALFQVKTIDELNSLVIKGVDINTQNLMGQSLLHKFVIENNTEMIQELLNKNINVKLADVNGKTAISYAKSENVVKMIIPYLNNQDYDTSLNLLQNFNNQHVQHIINPSLKKMKTFCLNNLCV